MIRRVVVFGLVGALATVVHFALASAVYHLLPYSIFVANTAGFVVAFFVSYFGHYHLTFRSDAAHRRSLARFLVTALAGFTINTLALAVMTYATGRESLTTLAASILIAALAVYLLSRRWVFVRRGGARPFGGHFASFVTSAAAITLPLFT